MSKKEPEIVDAVTEKYGASEEIDVLHQRLLAPFPKRETEVRAGGFVYGQGVMPLFYVTARAYQKRLTQVFGVDGYDVSVGNVQLAFEHTVKRAYKEGEEPVHNEGLLAACSCTISIHKGEFRRLASDVGEKGLTGGDDNKVTSAFSQAFKRAATQLGVGAYLYFIEMGPQAHDKKNGFNFDMPPDDVLEEALKSSGFRSKCEITGAHTPWKVASASMHLFGRVLCAEEFQKLLPTNPA